MSESSNEPVPQQPQGERMIDEAPVSIDLPLLIEEIRKDPGNRNTVTVFKTDGLRIVLIALGKGSEMARHTAPGVISVQVLEGRIRFTTDQRPVELGKGQMLALNERIPHSVLAIEETIFLLTLSTSPRT